MEKVEFMLDGEKFEWYVVEQTKINETTYILVTDAPEGDAECFILKETQLGEEEAVYEIIESDEELQAVAKVFDELLEDIDVEI